MEVVSAPLPWGSLPPDWLGTLHSIYIDFGPKVRFYGHPNPLPKPKAQRVVTGSKGGTTAASALVETHHFSLYSVLWVFLHQ